jgi:hypothetical protein
LGCSLLTTYHAFGYRRFVPSMSSINYLAFDFLDAFPLLSEYLDYSDEQSFLIILSDYHIVEGYLKLCCCRSNIRYCSKT